MKRMFTRKIPNAAQGGPIEVRRTQKGWKSVREGYYFSDRYYTSVEFKSQVA